MAGSPQAQVDVLRWGPTPRAAPRRAHERPGQIELIIKHRALFDEDVNSSRSRRWGARGVGVRPRGAPAAGLRQPTNRSAEGGAAPSPRTMAGRPKAAKRRSAANGEVDGAARATQNDMKKGEGVGLLAKSVLAGRVPAPIHRSIAYGGCVRSEMADACLAKP